MACYSNVATGFSSASLLSLEFTGTALCSFLGNECDLVVVHIRGACPAVLPLCPEMGWYLWVLYCEA